MIYLNGTPCGDKFLVCHRGHLPALFAKRCSFAFETILGGQKILIGLFP
jgi:hypothetical protein